MAKQPTHGQRITALENGYGRVEEKLDTLQQTVVGNGKTGLLADVAYIRGKIDGISGPGPSKRTITIRRVLEVGTVAAILGLVVAGTVLLLAGRLTPENIGEILRAWRGTP